jgi:hypothetical protein
MSEYGQEYEVLLRTDTPDLDAEKVGNGVKTVKPK